MQEEVLRLWHHSLLDGNAGGHEIGGLGRGMGVSLGFPFREIEGFAALLDIERNHPGDRGDLAVPGKVSFIGVTVAAGAFEEGCNLRRGCAERLESVGAADGGILAEAGWDALHGEPDGCQSEQQSHAG